MKGTKAFHSRHRGDGPRCGRRLSSNSKSIQYQKHQDIRTGPFSCTKASGRQSCGAQDAGPTGGWGGRVGWGLRTVE